MNIAECVGDVIVFQCGNKTRNNIDPPLDPGRFYRATIHGVVEKKGDLLLALWFVSYHHGGADLCPHDRLTLYLSDLIFWRVWP
jgi:hypothetical protein